jgi:hypothetical protein
MLKRMLASASKLFPESTRRSLRGRLGILLGSSIAFRGFRHALKWEGNSNAPPVPTSVRNPLESYFDAYTQGPGIWKWKHYFDVYHRHLAKFVGKQPALIEIGVYSGGSFGMWRDYFGPDCRLYGIDIEDACKVYDSEQVKIFIGDQADRNFWRDFRAQVPPVDIVIDDGGHRDFQQIITLEETLPYLKPGGVYICEDVHGDTNRFTDYVHGLVHSLNAFHIKLGTQSEIEPTPFQKSVASVHQYAFMVVIERSQTPVAEFVAPRHGTQWQPFVLD